MQPSTSRNPSKVQIGINHQLPRQPAGATAPGVFVGVHCPDAGVIPGNGSSDTLTGSSAAVGGDLGAVGAGGHLPFGAVDSVIIAGGKASVRGSGGLFAFRHNAGSVSLLGVVVLRVGLRFGELTIGCDVTKLNNPLS